MRSTVEMLTDAWTIQDVESLDVPDWWRYQIVDGALFVSPAASFGHELASHRVRAAIDAHLPGELVVVGPIGIDLKSSYLIPDLVVLPLATSPRTPNLSPADVRLAVEVVSPSSVSMDRVTKPAVYAAAGIGAYWRVETDPVSLTAYILRDGRYAELGTWQPGQIAAIAEPFPVRVVIDDLVPPSAN